MSMLDKDRVDNLATRVNHAVDEAAEHLLQYLLRETFAPASTSFNAYARQLQKLALEAAGSTAAEIEAMGEHNDEHPRYQLYYAELSLLLQKVLARTADRMSF